MPSSARRHPPHPNAHTCQAQSGFTEAKQFRRHSCFSFATAILPGLSIGGVVAPSFCWPVVGIRHMFTTGLRQRSIGGDEFILAMPGTSAEAAGVVMERMRGELNAQVLEAEGVRLHISSSFGWHSCGCRI